MQQSAFLLLGSNRGDREQLLLQACAGIREKTGIIRNISSLYETDPWGFDDEIPFFNQALELETSLEPEELLARIQSIEKDLGRVRGDGTCGPACDCNTETYASRTIDIDILLYGSIILFTGDLMIPHPRLHERKFTLVPLNEIAPLFVHPVYRKTISELLVACTDKGGVTRLDR